MTSLPKILLVDDLPANLLGLSTVLSPLPVELLTATTGDEALRLTLNHTFALAILDVQMPGMDGYELAKLLRLDQRTKNTPIIFLSAVHSDDYHQFMGYRSGAVDFITKPFNPEFLLHKVRIFLELHEHSLALSQGKLQLESLLAEQQRTNAELHREIAERKAVEAQLQAAKERAEVLSGAKSEFLATMSHEIRTPLNGIMGMLQLAQTETMPPELREYVDTALASSRSLLRILSDILDISKIEAGAMPFEAEDFTLDEIIRPIMLSFRDVAERKGIDLAIHVEPDVPKRLTSDPGRLRQILFNLIGNAVKFTTKGSVTLEVYPLPSCALAGHQSIHFAVVDTGMGVADEEVDNIFALFTQVEGTYSRRFGGIGLGLAIVKRLVDLMKGSIVISSVLGQGTQMHITLPLQVPAQEDPVGMSPQLDSAPATDSSVPARILVVEDESINRLTAMRFLNHLGYEAMSAENGFQALELLKTNLFDAILMDVQMPGMDGLEATRRIRVSAEALTSANVPIIAVTAHSMAGDRERFLAAGMDGYLPKPMEKEDLRTTLARLLAATHRNTKGRGPL